MTALEWAGFAAGITTTLIGVLAGLRYLVRGWLNELRPNGGSSMKDQLTSLQKYLIEVNNVIDKENEKRGIDIKLPDMPWKKEAKQ
jgi:hypothetical protein